MLDLEHSLASFDLGHLHIIAELWGTPLQASDARRALQALVPALLDRELVGEVLESLPQDARLALDELCAHDGRLPWAQFTRRYGAIREVGPARRDRERPYRSPANPSEVLWYRALLARAFLDTPQGAQEFAFVPSDLLALLPREPASAGAPLGRAASQKECAVVLPAHDGILDHACTLLAALRLGAPPEALHQVLSPAWQALQLPISLPAQGLPAATLVDLLACAGLLDGAGQPLSEPVRLFLEARRGQALAALFSAWRASNQFNDLRHVPGLLFEGDWKNDPLRARQAILAWLANLPERTWWSLPAFVSAVRQAHPDYQRPAGDYDSWYIRDAQRDVFLRGFAAWDDVDGALIRFIICGPLHWMGILDLAAPTPGAPATAFRPSAWAEALLKGAEPEGLPAETLKLDAASDGALRVPHLVPRAARYQVARFAAWEGERDGVYLYRLTPASLSLAQKSGLRIPALLALLSRHAAALPPSLERALQRWEEHGSEARLEQALILRVRTPEMLQTLRASRMARFLGDPLGPTVITVKPGALKKVLAMLTELGYLAEANIDE
ncbi:MAG: helicase-associated domain-containing protein [Anaerolineales bacterium]|nr:helicase-associated domain-containing protein [Anaerolineales bacterium]